MRAAWASALHQAVAIGGNNVKTFILDGKLAYFYILDEQGQAVIQVGRTATRSLVCIDENLRPITLEVKYMMNPYCAAAVTIEKKEVPTGLDEQQILKIVAQVLGGNIT